MKDRAIRYRNQISADFGVFRPIRALHPAGTYAIDSADTIDISSRDACLYRGGQRRKA
jgi:hypothetical protein